MVFGFQRTDDVGVGDGVGDPGRLVRVDRTEAYGQNVGRQDAFDLEILLQRLHRGPFELVRRRRSIAAAEQVEHGSNDGRDDAGVGAGEFRILGEFEFAYDREDEVVRVQDFHLAVDKAGIDQGAVDGAAAVLVHDLRLARIHQDTRVRREHRRGCHQIDEHQREHAARNCGDQRPLLAQDGDNALNAQDCPADCETGFVLRMEFNSGLIHWSVRMSNNDHCGRGMLAKGSAISVFHSPENILPPSGLGGGAAGLPIVY